MPPRKTISQSQKNVKLEDIGSSKDSFEPVSLDAVAEALIDLAVKFKVTAENELSVQDAIDQGLLADSIQFDEVKHLGGTYSVNISVLEYYKWVNSGVQGTVSGASSGGFKFKNNRVSKNMLFAIRKWVIRHGLKSRAREVGNKGGKYALGTERKTLKFDNTSNSTAYAIATSIKKKGLKATHFWDKAEVAVVKEVENSLAEGFAIDIINAISKKK